MGKFIYYTKFLPIDGDIVLGKPIWYENRYHGSMLEDKTIMMPKYPKIITRHEFYTFILAQPAKMYLCTKELYIDNIVFHNDGAVGIVTETEYNDAKEVMIEWFGKYADNRAERTSIKYLNRPLGGISEGATWIDKECIISSLNDFRLIVEDGSGDMIEIKEDEIDVWDSYNESTFAFRCPSSKNHFH